MTGEQGILVTRIEDLPEPLVDGSRRVACQTCYEACWLAPSSWHCWESGDYFVECTRCAPHAVLAMYQQESLRRLS